MPIYKRCSRCRKRIAAGSQCSCMQSRYQRENRETDKETSFYKTGAWLKAREATIAGSYGIDIYSYYILGILEYGETVHHIEPIRENWKRRLDLSNLIYLTEINHQRIHAQMNQGEEKKQQIEKELFELKKRFETEFGREGVGEKVF